jgi:hypothetical protein
MKSKTLDHACEAAKLIIDETQSANALADPVGKIDWTKMKALLARLIETLVPIIIPLIVGKLDPTTITPEPTTPV